MSARKAVLLHSLIFMPQKMSMIIQRNILGILDINSKLVQVKRGIWCTWEFPSPWWFKLNIDGSARSDISTGRGIIRNTHGNMVTAFYNFHGSGSNNFAKFATLRDGLSLCRAFGITQVSVQSDSILVVNAIRTQRLTNWRLKYIFRECLTALVSTPPKYCTYLQTGKHGCSSTR